MLRALLAALLLAGVFSAGRPVQAYAADAPTVDANIMARAKEWFYRFQSGNIDRSQLDRLSNLQLTDESVRRESALLKKYGTPTSFVYVGSQPIMASVVGYNFRLTFDKGLIVESIAFNPNGLIVGIDFRTYDKVGRLQLPNQPLATIAVPGK